MYNHLGGIVMKANAILAACALTLTCSVSFADQDNSNGGGFTTCKDLVAKCTPGSADYDRNFCHGFMVGADQAHTTMSFVQRKQKSFDMSRDGVAYCPPKDAATYGGALKIIIDYIQNNPSKLNKLPAGYCALLALRKTYSCKKVQRVPERF